MRIIADVKKISETVQRNLTFILDFFFFQNLAFILPSF